MTLQVSDRIAQMVRDQVITDADAQRFATFVETCNNELMTHRVITDNKYGQWFAEGDLNRDNVTHFVVQFSVFSNLFLIAQTLKMINATTLEGMRASKEILANELGVIFHKPGNALENVTDTDTEGDPDLVTIEGSVDGGTFRFRAGHFEWLLKIGEVLDLGFNDMGKRRNGTPATIFFCDQLNLIYGHEDANIAEGASFAVENWAAAGFWKQIIAGLQAFKNKADLPLPLAFFNWHDRIEDQHAGHVMDELEELFFTAEFDEAKFLQGGKDMLDGVEAFWVGLNEQRITAVHA
jgi:hypothetical protein